jgi:hypothetical protein
VCRHESGGGNGSIGNGHTDQTHLSRCVANKTLVQFHEVNAKFDDRATLSEPSDMQDVHE